MQEMEEQRNKEGRKEGRRDERKEGREGRRHIQRREHVHNTGNGERKENESLPKEIYRATATSLCCETRRDLKIRHASSVRLPRHVIFILRAEHTTGRREERGREREGGRESEGESE